MEVLELGAVLALWEMHDRGPRMQQGTTSSTRAETMKRLMQASKNKPPTLPFSIAADDIYCVLPAQMWFSEAARATSHRELAQRYRLLLKEKLDTYSMANGSAETGSAMRAAHSRTFQRVREVRTESRGVSFDSEVCTALFANPPITPWPPPLALSFLCCHITPLLQGRVVVDKRAAERIIRLRMLDHSLSFGAAYTVHLWMGVGQPLQKLTLAVNQRGLHLYSLEPEPQCVTTYEFNWQSENTLVGWQTLDLPLDDPSSPTASPSGVEAFTADKMAGGAAAALVTQSVFVAHVLTMPPGSEIRPWGASLSGSDSDAKQRRRMSWQRASAAVVKQGEGGAERVSRGSQGSRASRASRKHSLLLQERERAKLLVLTNEAVELKERLRQFAQEHAQEHVRSKARAKALAMGKRISQTTATRGSRDSAGAQAGGGAYWAQLRKATCGSRFAASNEGSVTAR